MLKEKSQYLKYGSRFRNRLDRKEIALLKIDWQRSCMQ